MNNIQVLKFTTNFKGKPFNACTHERVFSPFSASLSCSLFTVKKDKRLQNQFYPIFSHFYTSLWPAVSPKKRAEKEGSKKGRKAVGVNRPLAAHCHFIKASVLEMQQTCKSFEMNMQSSISVYKQ